MIFQQPEELPQPTPSEPEEQFGAYSLEYFIEQNWWYILGVILILIIVFGYSWSVRRRRNSEKED